jgi:Domain of unknown function (DUF4403)
MDCKALAVIGVPAGFACGLYRTVGPLIGGVTDYRYKIAADRSSLAVRSNIGESTDVRFSIDVSLGYQIELRGRYNTHGCGDPLHDVNPSTGKTDYLHLHLHELISLRPTSDYGLRATFAHTLSPDAACTIETLPPLMHRDLTSAVIAFVDQLIRRGEDQLKQRVIGSSSGLQAGTNDTWQRLEQPFTMASSFGSYQVLLHPTTAALSLLTTSGGGDLESVTGSILLGVSPEIRTDVGKSIQSAPRPPLGEAVGPGERNKVPAVATADYGFVSAALRKRLAGRRLRYGPLRFQITDATVFPTLSSSNVSQLVAAAHYRGGILGAVYAWGTPTFNAAADRLSVPDLQIAPNANGLTSDIALLIEIDVRHMRMRHAAFVGNRLNPAHFSKVVGRIPTGLHVHDADDVLLRRVGEIVVEQIRSSDRGGCSEGPGWLRWLEPRVAMVLKVPEMDVGVGDRKVHTAHPGFPIWPAVRASARRSPADPLKHKYTIFTMGQRPRMCVKVRAE